MTLRNDLSLDEILERFESHLRNDLSRTEETVDQYLRKIRKFVEVLQIVSLENITPDNINTEWLFKFWDQYGGDKSLADSTRRVYQSALKAFLKFCEEAHLVKRGTAKRIRLAKPTEIFTGGLSDEEQKKLRSHLAKSLQTEVGRRNTALIFFMWSTACRISEALSLDCHADGVVYTDNPLLRSGSFFVTHKNYYVHINGKGKRNREIAVSQEAIAYLNFYLHNREHKSRAVFLSHARNKPTGRLTRGGAYKAVARVFEDAGITVPDQLVTHILRHTAIDTWIDKNFSPKKIIAMTGHASELGLEPYFRRRKELTKEFAEHGNPLAMSTDKKTEQFEDILIARYARLQDAQSH